MTDISQSNDSTTLQTGGGMDGGSSGGGGTTADKFKSQFSSFKGQATDKARDVAGKGVGRATDALDEAARFLEDTARTVEEKLGPQYGRYGFSAAESVHGFAEQMRGKDVDELVEDVRTLVRKSPAVAIGAAVGLGFVLARLAKAGAGYENDYQGSGATGGTAQGMTSSTGATSTGVTGGAMGGSSVGGSATTTTSPGTTGTSGVGAGGLGGTTNANDSGSPINPTFPA